MRLWKERKMIEYEIWVIGYLFTIGMSEDPNPPWKDRLIEFFLWPAVLGSCLRLRINKQLPGGDDE